MNLSIADLYANTIDICEIYEALHFSIPAIVYWVYLCSGTLFPERKRMDDVAINHVVKAESSLWSPEWGLKGIIDTVCNVHTNPLNKDLPFEFKTGSEDGISHGAQITLYSLLLSQFQNEEDFVLYTPSPPSGYLVYLKSPSFTETESRGYNDSQYQAIKMELETGKKSPYVTQILIQAKNRAEALVIGADKRVSLNIKPQTINTTHVKALLMRRNLIVSYLERERRRCQKQSSLTEIDNDIEDLVRLNYGGDE